MRKLYIGLGFIILVIMIISIWQVHVNSLGYEFRNCTEISDDNNWIQFSCPNKNPHYPPSIYYVPENERNLVINDLNPDDTINNGM